MALKILIIHADDYFRRHLSKRMRQERFHVLEVGPEAGSADIIGKNNFDVVLLGMKGYRQKLSLLRSIREMSPCTEVILLTALEEHSLYDSIQAMQLGAFDDLLVPVDVKTLLTRIRDAYKRKKEKVKTRRSLMARGREKQAVPAGPAASGND